jgi:hypothetical protein
MSTAITMQELDLETAELLPSRETLSCGYSRHSGSSITNVVGNTSQVGLVNVSAFNGEGNSLNILSNIL